MLERIPIRTRARIYCNHHAHHNYFNLWFFKMSLSTKKIPGKGVQKLKDPQDFNIVVRKKASDEVVDDTTNRTVLKPTEPSSKRRRKVSLETVVVAVVGVLGAVGAGAAAYSVMSGVGNALQRVGFSGFPGFSWTQDGLHIGVSVQNAIQGATVFFSVAAAWMAGWMYTQPQIRDA